MSTPTYFGNTGTVLTPMTFRRHINVKSSTHEDTGAVQRTSAASANL
jgi:hypothetical protein